MRLDRILNYVAPLVTRGATAEEVAKAVGISVPMAKRDISVCLQMWHENYFEEHERWRPLMVSRYELLFREAVQAWEEGRDKGRPQVRYLDSANRILGDLAKMLGLVIDVNLTQNNVHVGATADSATALAPLDADSYAQMLHAGALEALNAVPPRPVADPIHADLLNGAPEPLEAPA